MSVRASVRVFDVQDGKAVPTGTCAMPEVFKVHVRPDVIQTVVQRLQLNTRQPYAVSNFAGYQTAAESWGTGRAVARVPRVPGRGSHRSGQAAFANFCRGGGMFSPTNTWRRWHRKTTSTTRKHCQAYAISSGAVPSLVTARGHSIETVQEFPIVCSNRIEQLTKTHEVIKFLEGLGLGPEIKRCQASKRIRAGKGKNRNRKYKHATGPLIVFSNGECISKTVRKALLGVDTCNVAYLQSRRLAPGGRAGRCMIFTQSAFEYLNTQFGDVDGNSVKGGYRLPRNLITAESVDSVMSSEAVLSVVRPKMRDIIPAKPQSGYKNALRHPGMMKKLNPAVEDLKAIRAQRKAQRDAAKK